MKTKINNIDELKWEIARLTEKKVQQEIYLNNQYTLLKNKVDTPFRVLNKFSSSIPGVGLFKDVITASSSLKSEKFKDSNWLQSVVRVGLPLVLNRTFLKKTGWIKKSIILFLTDSAAKQVSQDNISSAISKVADFIRSKNKRNKTEKSKQLVEEDRVEDQILGI